MIVQVLLAAGLSSRMGRSKPLLDFGGEPLLARMVAMASRSRVDEILVVLGHEADRIRETIDLRSVTVVVNERYERGQTTSLQAAVAALPAAARAFVNLPVDYPLVTERDIDLLIEAYETRPPGGATVFTAAHQGKRGRPTLFDRTHFPEILALGPDEPTRSLLSKHASAVREIEVDNPSILTDMDTPDDYQRLLRQHGATEGT